GHYVERLERNRERLGRRQFVVIKKLRARREELLGGGDAPDAMQELTARFHAESDEVHVLLHVRYLRRLTNPANADRVVARVHICEHVATSRAEPRQACAVFADLAEEQRITNHAATDHQTVRASLRENF